jgi:hypothetical protein
MSITRYFVFSNENHFTQASKMVYRIASDIFTGNLAPHHRL